MKTIVLTLIAFTLWPSEEAPLLRSDVNGSARTTSRANDPQLRGSGAIRGAAPAPLSREVRKERLVVDVDNSIIQWKGTKFWGIGKHEGVVRIAKGDIIIREEAILAGRFVLDMTTIEVTDIPASDPIPRRRLREHLKDEHFFFVERYPTAVFDISEAHKEAPGRYRISGRLTMRGKTRGVTFEAHIPFIDGNALRATARFSINRHDWGVAYRGSRLTNDLVDDMIELNLVLVADKPEV